MRGVCEAVRIDCRREMMGNGESGAKRGGEIALAKDVDELTDRALMRCASCPIALYRCSFPFLYPTNYSLLLLPSRIPPCLCLFPPHIHTHTHPSFSPSFFLHHPSVFFLMLSIPGIFRRASIRQRSRVGGSMAIWDTGNQTPEAAACAWPDHYHFGDGGGGRCLATDAQVWLGMTSGEIHQRSLSTLQPRLQTLLNDHAKKSANLQTQNRGYCKRIKLSLKPLKSCLCLKVDR